MRSSRPDVRLSCSCHGGEVRPTSLRRCRRRRARRRPSGAVPMTDAEEELYACSSTTVGLEIEMTTDEVLEHARKLKAKFSTSHVNSPQYSGRYDGLAAEVIEFLRAYAGAQSAFYTKAVKGSNGRDSWVANSLMSILGSFIDYVESGLHARISPERQAQLDVVSDFLEQADTLLNTQGVHPAAPAVLIGATLEEFLRTWVKSVPLPLEEKKPSLQSYAQLLKGSDLITKQDVKDITSWGGTRNHAAHGEWDNVGDSKRVRLMLEGVDLFMRRYGT